MVLIFQCAKQVVDILLLIERVIAAKAMFGSYQLLVLIKLILFEALGLSKFLLLVSFHSASVSPIEMVSSCTHKNTHHPSAAYFRQLLFHAIGQSIENNTTELLRTHTHDLR